MAAVKCILKEKLNKVSTENLLTEIELLKTLKHENIVELKDFQVRIITTFAKLNKSQMA